MLHLIASFLCACGRDRFDVAQRENHSTVRIVYQVLATFAVAGLSAAFGTGRLLNPPRHPCIPSSLSCVHNLSWTQTTKANSSWLVGWLQPDLALSGDPEERLQCLHTSCFLVRDKLKHQTSSLLWVERHEREDRIRPTALFDTATPARKA